MDYIRRISLQELIEKINSEEVDLSSVDWLKYFPVRGYYDIKYCLFDKIDRRHWASVYRAFLEACEYSPYKCVKEWKEGCGRSQLHEIEKAISKTGNGCNAEKAVLDKTPSDVKKNVFSIPTGKVDKIKKIHQYLLDTESINVVWETFQNAIIQADFSGFYEGGIRANLKYTITKLRNVLGGDWYSEVCTSIKLTKKQAEGGKPSKDFVHGFPQM